MFLRMSPTTPEKLVFLCEDIWYTAQNLRKREDGINPQFVTYILAPKRF